MREASSAALDWRSESAVAQTVQADSAARLSAIEVEEQLLTWVGGVAAQCSAWCRAEDARSTALVPVLDVL